MEPITIPFTRGGKNFEAKATKSTCTITDLETDESTQLQYVNNITDIHIKTAHGSVKSVTVKFESGILSPGGMILEKNTRSWSFSGDHPDMQFFENAYGLGFMMSCINGFVKHFMPINIKYAELESQFKGVVDHLGSKIVENDD